MRKLLKPNKKLLANYFNAYDSEVQAGCLAPCNTQSGCVGCPITVDAGCKKCKG